MAWITGKRGAYRVMWREGGRGTSPKASKTYNDKADALEKQREIEADQASKKADTNPALSSTPIPDLLKRWKASRLAGRRAREPYTKEAVAHVQAMADEMKWKRVGDITTEGVDRWRSKRTDGKGTDKPLQCVKTFVRWCRRNLKLRIDDAVVEIEPRRVPHRQPPPLLTDEQVAMILGRALTFGVSFGAMIEHLLLYACRPIDVSRLLVSDWDSSARMITYRGTKNLSDVRHPVHEAHAKRLDEVAKDRKPTDHLFVNKYGKPWLVTEIGQASGITSWYKANVGEWVLRKEKAADGAETKVYALPPGQRGIYCLKDYAMSRLSRAAGGDRRAVVAISGHKSLTVVDRYMSTNDATQRRLIDAITIPADA